MASPSKRLVARVARAAQLRANGNRWETIGRILKCRPQTCQSWPTRFPALWAYHYGRQEQARFEATQRLAVQTLAELLRSPDEAVRKRAERLVRRFPNALPGPSRPA